MEKNAHFEKPQPSAQPAQGPQDSGSPLDGSLDANRYNVLAIRALLRDAFTVDDLPRFCHDRPAFRPVVRQFARNASLDDMIDVLIQYCEQYSRFPELLSEISTYNSRQYARYRDRLLVDSPPLEGFPEHRAPKEGAKQQTEPGVGGGVYVEGSIRAEGDVIVIGRDGHISQGQPPSSAEASEADRGLVRVMAVVVGMAGLVGAVFWLQKAVPGLTPEFLIPLVIILAAIVLGAMGILKPDRVAAILMSRRDGAEK